MTRSARDPQSAIPEFLGKQTTLRDGRRLGYAEFGDPGGRAVFFCHGFPASRLDARLAHDAATRLNIRLIAPDRPGFGLSDYHSGRRVADWPRDVVELADALSLGRFAVIGVSGGAPYAVACAGQIPDRLTTVSIVCGLGQLDSGADSTGMSPFSRFSFALARSVPALSKLLNFALAPVLRDSPHWILKLLASRLPAPDRAVLADPKVFAMFADSFREAFRQGGRGAAHDMTLYVQPWETRVESIRVPCHLWHGEQDTTVPVAMGRRLAAAIPECRTTFLPDEGHFSLPVRRMDEILSVLV